MAERPDSPIADSPEPIEPFEGEEQTVHHVSQRKKRKKGPGGEEMELQLTSMIDVIFQLLIYFVITANFVIDEGSIIATLPGNSSEDSPDLELPPPKLVMLNSTDDGVTYRLTLRGQPLDGVAHLTQELKTGLDSRGWKVDDPVLIKPDSTVRWHHVVNVYNACIKSGMESVGFAP